MSRITSFDDGRRRRRNGRERIVESWTPIIEYSYQVAGKDLLSRSIRRHTQLAGDQKSASAFVRRYPVDTEVRVHVNPADPEDACLERGLGASWMMLVMAGVFALAAAAVLWKG
jgi:hypothetical protein